MLYGSVLPLPVNARAELISPVVWFILNNPGIKHFKIFWQIFKMSLKLFVN